MAQTPADNTPISDSPTSQATFGGGCFWCTEAVFEQLKGVQDVVSGYTGGKSIKPTYEEVCSGLSGHAEVVRITYDPGAISYSDLLEVFFKTHDPTTLNRQGADRGTQYRSVVYYHDDEQKRTAEAVVAALDKSGAFNSKIVTEISPAETFYPAEAYHQDYFSLNPTQGYCRAVIVPKMAKFRQAFADRLSDSAASE
ncbi:Peptide methionine sulfoxide reductase MsrA [Pseudobythopirellula maris]|uniref:Peptide methionine sulfoxide reductase MsrA n=1 Tax=Pseudobythopirellula maris TaxID=2527991 RepID=A0A5C5ZJY9_9BACT|nr:peptide-methionine (S)-S-oxide reductase MsrA [Pseudobythopirellula maris]TWT87734.1 Peptide methionine sulfoxide reductase MsrA [Pseudobythopirellula maris]